VRGRRVLRSAKDLGRVLALARLASRDEIESWVPLWNEALRVSHSPSVAAQLALHAGDGLRALLDDIAALEDARHALDVGLLRGFSISTEALRAIAAQFFVDAIEPLADRARA
jgi:hypothetical protein